MKKKFMFVVLILIVVGGVFAAPRQQSSNPIGIISAMTVEMEYLKDHMTNITEYNIGDTVYYSGRLQGKDIVLVSGGVGKVYNAASTAVLITRFNPRAIIFTGIAGGVKEGIKTLDVVIANGLVQHDYGNYVPLEDGDFYNFQWSGGPYYLRSRYPDAILPVDPTLSSLAYEIAQQVVGRDHAYQGLIATGDQFIESSDYVQFLRSKFNTFAVEMEGAAVAAIAARFNVPLVIIRALSDNADEAAALTYTELEQKSSEISEQIVMELLSRMP